MDSDGTAGHTRPVPAGRWQIERLVYDVAALGRRGLPRERYYAEVGARLRRVFQSDAGCRHTIDPQTRLLTSDAPEELISSGVYTQTTAAQAGARLIASEYFIPDVNTFAGLATRRVPVGILSQVTNGHPGRSTRYNDLLAPSGIPFEMRAAFVSRGRAWGAVHFARRDDKQDFTGQDAAALASVAGLIADGIRTSLRFDAARGATDASAPGFVLLGPRDEVEMITPPARELFATMNSKRAAWGETPPAPVLALAGFTRSRASTAAGEGDAVAVPTSSGWVTLHASLPEGRADGRVAIVLERASSPQSTAVRLEADGVTAREREIASLLAQGLTNPEIAETLVLSPYTVQDHIKSLFEKTGVSSRQELVARIFLDDYMPHLARRTPLTSNGGFG
jgi:DNA-binding CsgD family transcriptional regulator